MPHLVSPQQPSWTMSTCVNVSRVPRMAARPEVLTLMDYFEDLSDFLRVGEQFYVLPAMFEGCSFSVSLSIHITVFFHLSCLGLHAVVGCGFYLPFPIC